MGVLDLLRRLKRRPREEPAAGARPDAAPEKPGNIRLAVLGHTRSGKTVFYTMLYERLKDHPEIQLSPEDPETAQKLADYLQKMKGLRPGEAEGGGTAPGTITRRFPPPTPDVVQFRFRVTAAGYPPFSFEAKEYFGELLDLKNIPQVEEYVRDFFSKADCILFLIEPDAYRSELEREPRISAFNILLQRTVGWRLKTNVPVGLVISKADLLGGFHDESQVEMIPKHLRFARHRTFERLREAVLKEPAVSADPAWRSSVTEALDRLRGFIRHLLAHTHEFQFFFVSSVGSVDKIVNEFGLEEPIPPARLRPVGLEKPFLWFLDQVRRRTRLRRARLAAAIMACASVLWLAIVGSVYFPRAAAYGSIVQPVVSARLPASELMAKHSAMSWFLTDDEKEMLLRLGPSEADPVARLKEDLARAGCPPGFWTTCAANTECEKVLQAWEGKRDADLTLIRTARARALAERVRLVGADLLAAVGRLNPDDTLSGAEMLGRAREVIDCSPFAGGDLWKPDVLPKADCVTRILGDPNAVQFTYEPARAALTLYAQNIGGCPGLDGLEAWLCGHAARIVEAESRTQTSVELDQAITHASNYLGSTPRCGAYFPRVQAARDEARYRRQQLTQQASGGTEGGGPSGPTGPASTPPPVPPVPPPPAPSTYGLKLKIVEIDPDNYHLHLAVGDGQPWDEAVYEKGDVIMRAGLDQNVPLHIGVSTFQACQTGTKVLGKVVARGAPRSAAELKATELGAAIPDIVVPIPVALSVRVRLSAAP